MIDNGGALSPLRRGKTVAEEVEARLIMAIAIGDKKPGERITEAQVAKALNISRVPAREAMQKLQLRGILVGGEQQRGLKVLDYSPRRISELFELRMAVERIILLHVMASAMDRTHMIGELELLVDHMRELSGSGDPLALSSVDLEFHRTVVRASGNKLAAQMWEGLAKHLLIVFCRDWSAADDRIGEVELHESLIEFLRHGVVDEIGDVLSEHFRAPGR